MTKHETVLIETLAAIESERGGKFRRSFDLAQRLVEQWGEDELADRLYAAIPESCPWEVVADLFSILIWTSVEGGINDNGTAISRTVERWLRENDDLRRIQIALHLDVYPFLDPDEMKTVLSAVANRYPEVADRCSELISTRPSSKSR